jgi:hypothetical protein
MQSNHKTQKAVDKNAPIMAVPARIVAQNKMPETDLFIMCNAAFPLN